MKGKIKRDTSGLVVHIPDNVVKMLGLEVGDEVNVQFNLNSDIPAPKNMKSGSAKKISRSACVADPFIKGSLYEVEYLRDKNDETAHVARIVSDTHTGTDIDAKNLARTLKYIEGSSVVIISYTYIKDVKKSPLEVKED